jgi:hypothetical protein
MNQAARRSNLGNSIVLIDQQYVITSRASAG